MKTGKVAETIRSWPDSKPPRSNETISGPEFSRGLQFLPVSEVEKRSDCSSMAANRMVRKDLLPKTCLGAQNLRISLKGIEKYEADCRD